MSAVIWLLAGATAAWITCSILDLDAARGLTIFAVIGLAGVVFGGDALAPAYGAVAQETAIRSPFEVLVVCVIALACMKIAGVVHRHFKAGAVNSA